MTMPLVLRGLCGGLVALALMLTVGCGPSAGVDDGDGGKLLSGEEEQVLAWVTELSSLMQTMDEIDDPMTGGDEARAAAMNTINSVLAIDPPRIRDAEANQAFQDIHSAMTTGMEFVRDMLNEMPPPDADQATMMAFQSQMMQRMQSMAEIAQQMESASERVQAIVEVDFADNPEALALFRDMSSGMM